jgi:heme-degrading monooxygenase HmoA
MPKLVEMDPAETLFAQIELTAGPIVLLNIFTVAPAEADQLVKAWTRDAAYMKKQPGFISTQFHRGVGGSAFMNYAVWETMADFKRAFFSPEFQAALKDYPPSTMTSPHVFSKLAIPGICEA